MSHQFKPGDLALTTRDGLVLPAMSQVELVGRIPEGTEVVAKSGEGFIAQAGLWEVTANGGRFAYHEAYLMPLRGDFAPRQAKSFEVPA